MATKGQFNPYGNSKGTATVNINYPYATGEYAGKKTENHKLKHLSDFKVETFEEYLAKAVHFANDVDRKNYLSFVDYGGTTYKYNPLNNELVIVRKDGSIVTYFKPDNKDYFKKERKKKVDYGRTFKRR